MAEPFTANISSVQDFMQCRFRWACKWILNRVPVAESPALTQGKILHEIFEDHLTGKGSMADCTARRLEEARKAGAHPKAITGIEDLAEALAQWRDQFEYEIPILEVEEPFEIAHPYDPNFRLLGRPDRRVVMAGKQWHVQNRGLASSMNFGVYMELASRHYHEHVYAEAGVIKYPQYPVGGTVMNLVRKLKYRTNVGKKNEAVKTLDQMFFQHPMAINMEGDLHKNVMVSLLLHLKEMKRVSDAWHEGHGLPPPNEKMNGGFNGSTIDPYFRVLTGQISLEDPAYFKPREDLYALESFSLTEE